MPKKAAKKSAKKSPAKKRPVAKKSAAKKTARRAKKAPARVALRSAPASKRSSVESLIDALIARAAKFAESNGARLQIEPGLTDAQIDAIAKSIKPHTGPFSFPIPPSYRAFLKRHGGIYLTGGEFHPDAFGILGPADIKTDTRELVHVPKGVEWETEAGDPCVIGTNHLVAFAVADSEARWCFCTDSVGPDGELPVYYHHQDEPRCAKDVKTGAWINPSAKKPSFRSFPEWLRAYVEAFCEGERLRG